MRYFDFQAITRLNAGIRNRHNFFLSPIFLFQKIGFDSVNHTDSENMNIFGQFPGNPILKFLLNFWNYLWPFMTIICSLSRKRICKSITIIHTQLTLKLFVVRQTFLRASQHWRCVLIQCMLHQKYSNIIKKIRY